MKIPYTRMYAEIHLDRIRNNMEAMRANLPEQTKLIGVVKADGYGHGAVPVARAIDEYVWGYAVAVIDEGILLRKHGITKPILVLGNTHASRLKELAEYEIRPALFQTDKAKALSRIAQSMGKRAKVHIALDTGMGRIGFSPDEAGLEAAAGIGALPGVEIEGLFTHFARADETDPSHTKRQYALFREFAGGLEERGISVPIRHCANSAAIMEFPAMGMDAARAGISMYGIYPSDEVSREMVLEPAMEVKSLVTYVKEVEPGTAISYGGTFVAKRRMCIATIGAGYGDGYPRGASGRGHVLLHGKRVPILGRVCMDQLMVDVTDIPDCREDDVATLVGRDGDQVITMEELADTCGGFHYEIPCVLGKRVPRVYLDGGQIVGTKDYWNDRYEGTPFSI